jgi:hypothetical protein
MARPYDGSAYQTIVSAFQEELHREAETASAKLAVGAAAFADAVGCKPELMRVIDGMYDAELLSYRARVAALDAQFGPVRASRDQFFTSLLDRLERDRAALPRLDATVAQLKGMELPLVAANVAAQSDALTASIAEARLVLSKWFSRSGGQETPACSLDALPAALRARVEAELACDQAQPSPCSAATVTEGAAPGSIDASLGADLDEAFAAIAPKPLSKLGRRLTDLLPA